MDRDEVYTFDEYRLDVRERRVWRGTSLVALSPKAFDLLVVMLQGAGRLLEKDFLIRSVWPDSYVQDANLSVHISNLRKVLGKNSESQQFIETVPKIGYRLVVPVLRTSAFLDADIAPPTLPEQEVPSQQPEPEQHPGQQPGNHVPHPTSLPQLSTSWGAKAWLILFFLAICLAGVLTVALLLTRTHRGSDAATTTRPLTGTPGQFLQPSFSPDGQELAYTWSSGTDTHQSVYLQSISSQERRLLADTGGNDYSPAWSPDGTQIAFLHASNEPASSQNPSVEHLPVEAQPLEIIIAAKDNSALRRHVATVCPADDIFRTSPTLSWSPDGNTLVTTDCPAGNASPAVTLIAIKTGQKTTLTHPLPRTWDDQAAFSPDGTQIAFRRSRGDASDEIYVLPSTGGQERELTFRSSPVDGLAWSRDGKRIIFSSGQATSLGNIWSLSLAGGDPVAITTPLTHTSSPAIAPAGHRMAYVNSPRNVSVWRLSTGAHHEAEPFISSNFFDASAVYSPDGKHVAFRSDRSGTNEIWICGSDGAEPKSITHFNGPMTGSPHWSPDGRSIAFDSRVGGRADVYLVHVDGGEPVRITDAAKTNSDNVVPSWSHDGSAIYFSSNRTGTWQIWRHTLNGGAESQVTTHGGFNGMETGDGKSLLYVADLERTEIRQLALQGQPNDLPVASLGPGLWHAWTISGDNLYFLKPSSASSNSSTFTLFHLNLKSDLKSGLKAGLKAGLQAGLQAGRPQNLGQVGQAVNDSLSASPDGRWILFARGSNTDTSIMILDGWD